MSDTDDNPFQAPQNSQDVPQEPAVRAPGPVAVLIIVILATIGAGATFFVTCLGVLSIDSPGDWGFYVSAAAAFFGFVLFTRLGIIVANRFRRTNMVLSWLSIIVGAVFGAGTFICCGLLVNPQLAFFCSPAVCTLVIWQLHRILARRGRPPEKREQGFHEQL